MRTGGGKASLTVSGEKTSHLHDLERKRELIEIFFTATSRKGRGRSSKGEKSNPQCRIGKG